MFCQGDPLAASHTHRSTGKLRMFKFGVNVVLVVLSISASDHWHWHHELEHDAAALAGKDSESSVARHWHGPGASGQPWNFERTA